MIDRTEYPVSIETIQRGSEKSWSDGHLRLDPDSGQIEIRFKKPRFSKTPPTLVFEPRSIIHFGIVQVDDRLARLYASAIGISFLLLVGRRLMIRSGSRLRRLVLESLKCCWRC